MSLRRRCHYLQNETERKINMGLELKPITVENFDEAQTMMREAFAFTMPDLDREELEKELPTLEGIFELSDTVPLTAYENGEMAGGALLEIKSDGHNCLSLFWVKRNLIDHGIGRRIWTAIEQAYPQTKTWETMTPPTLLRNVYFYVNKCGFHIIKLEFENGKRDESMYIFRKTMA